MRTYWTGALRLVIEGRETATAALAYCDLLTGPTGEPVSLDERIDVPFDLDAGQGRWRIDLSVWLRDLHGHVAAWHEQLRDAITDQQGLAVLRIKDVWHRLPSYPDQVGGWEVYTAVLRDGVRTPEQFGRWLAANGFPGPDVASA